MHPRLLVQREKNNRVYCSCGIRAGATSFHFHSLIEIYLVESGEVNVWVNQKHKKLKAGEMAVVLSYDAHRYEPGKEASVSYLIAPCDMLTELENKAIENPFIESPSLFRRILSLLKVISENRNSLLTTGCIKMVFGLLIEETCFSMRETAAETGTITTTLLHLHDHFRENVTLSNAASALGFNPSYLSRSFRETLGIGFHQYLTMLRLREAVVLLSKGSPAEYWAFASGFNSVRTFYRAFLSEFGCSPGEYMNSIKNQ